MPQESPRHQGQESGYRQPTLRADQPGIHRREISIGEVLRAQEDSRQYHGMKLEQAREAMFDHACERLGKTPEQINTARQEVSRQDERLRSQGRRQGGGGELLEIAAMLSDSLGLFGKNARLIPTAKHDDYFQSVDFLLEWDTPNEKGGIDVKRLGVDFKQIRTGPDAEKRKQEIQEDIARGGPLRDLAFTVSDSAPADKREEQLSVAIVAATVDMDSLNGFFADLIDQRTGSIRDPLDPRFQRTLRDEFAHNKFRGTLLNALRENMSTQIQDLENLKPTFKGNEVELRKIDHALTGIKSARDIIDGLRKELGIGEVIAFRSREQQEQDAQEKSERTRMNKLLDEQERRIREFFKDTTAALGMTAEDYIASRKTASTTRGMDMLAQRAYDPATLKKITKRLAKEPSVRHDEQKAKQISILLSKSPLGGETYTSAKQHLATYRDSRTALKEEDPRFDARFEEFFRRDALAETLIAALRAHGEEYRTAA
ncbi:hypothetical protein HYV71_00155 [Candidatus Uhrbacteria bacterium]|nr:hypothetical protein [Candidatus Uhrbacteria bacterium]